MKQHLGSISAFALLLATVASTGASATDFPSSGGSYLANVAARVDKTGTFMTSATVTFAGAANSTDDPNVLCDSLSGSKKFTIQGLDSAADSATAVVDLGQVWNLNKLQTIYGWWDGVPAQYQLAVSTDNTNWTTVVPQTNVTGENVISTFDAIDARYVSWQVWGPHNGGQWGRPRPMELQAFVAVGAAKVPQLEDGFNVARDATYYMNNFNEFGHDFFNPAGLFDGSFHGDGGLYVATSDGTREAIVDLKATYTINRITADIYGIWNDGQIMITNGDPSNLDPSNWTVIKESGSLLDSSYVFAPKKARYVRIIGAAGNDKLMELQVFAINPAVPGDANGDSKVDFADYLILESSYGSGPTAADADADFDDNGVVEFADYLVLEANFGTGAVPEPLTMSLLMFGGVALLRGRR